MAGLNLRTDPDGVIRALTQVEGERWLERQKKGDFKGYSVFDAIAKLKEAKGPGSDFGIAIIYGADGWHRYRVAADGTVTFSGMQSTGPEATERARKAGFGIF